MKKFLYVLVGLMGILPPLQAQSVKYEEYDLKNGLHIILHQDRSAPVVTTSVMYYVGSKNEKVGRTGFAHFFEHLLFEGTENIKRGEWFKIVAANGGSNNANTDLDRTYYYEIFPSNNLKLALWMESERMLHPVINQIGVDTQREVVKEEKRLRFDNQAYGGLFDAILTNLFKKHPYRWTPIGSMEDLNAASLDEFKNFFKTYYIPNNAVLTVSGDFEKEEAKKWIKEYFEPIPSGKKIEKREIAQEDPITEQIEVTYTDPNIQLPMRLDVYRMPSMKTRDSRVLDMISSLLSRGKSSPLYKRLVDQEKLALEVSAFDISLEDYGIFVVSAIPMTGKTMDEVQTIIDEELNKLCTDLISEKDFQKLLNQYENSYVSSNSTTSKVAENLASYYLLYGDISLVNKEIDIYRSVTREEIREVANRYLKPSQRVLIDYIPAQ